MDARFPKDYQSSASNRGARAGSHRSRFDGTYHTGIECRTPTPEDPESPSSPKSKKPSDLNHRSRARRRVPYLRAFPTRIQADATLRCTAA